MTATWRQPAKNVGTACRKGELRLHDTGGDIRFTTVLGHGLLRGKDVRALGLPYFDQALDLLPGRTPDSGYPALHL